MKKFGDVVIYVRGEESVAALVLQSRIIAESHPDKLSPGDVDEPEMVEHLTLKYLDPAYASTAMSGGDMDKAVATAFDAVPLTEGKTNGWKSVGLALVDMDRIEGSPRGSEFSSAEEQARTSYAKDKRIEELEKELADQKEAGSALLEDNGRLKAAAASKPIADTEHALQIATHTPLDEIQRASLNEGYAVRCAVYEDGSTVTGVPPLPATNQGAWKKVDEVDHEEYVAKQKPPVEGNQPGAQTENQ